MFCVVVFDIPTDQFYFQVLKGLEFVFIVEFLLVGAVAALHRAVLGGFPRIDQVMGNFFLGTENIQRVQMLDRPVASSMGADRPIGEDRMVIGFDRMDPIRKKPYHFF
jgi:hypothetical protein